jgi:uncharacterized protein YneF (UPF0154 family)
MEHFMDILGVGVAILFFLLSGGFILLLKNLEGDR